MFSIYRNITITVLLFFASTAYSADVEIYINQLTPLAVIEDSTNTIAPMTQFNINNPLVFQGIDKSGYLVLLSASNNTVKIDWQIDNRDNGRITCKATAKGTQTTVFHEGKHCTVNIGSY